MTLIMPPTLKLPMFTSSHIPLTHPWNYSPISQRSPQRERPIVALDSLGESEPCHVRILAGSNSEEFQHTLNGLAAEWLSI